jgi:hypothetical protein
VNGVFTARIYRNAGGTLTQLASAPVGSGAGLLRFDVVGTSLQLFVDNTFVAKATDARVAGPGQVGVRGTPRSAFDAFNARQLFPTVFYDGFNRPDAADPGPAWTVMKGGVGVLGGQARATLAGTNLAVRDGVKVKDVSLEATVTLPGTGVQETGLVARARDANNYYYAALERDAGGAYSVSIYKVVGGVKTRLGAKVTVVSGTGTGTLRFEVTGNTLKLFFNGELQAGVGGTDGTFTAAGLAGVRGSLNTTFDNFNMA